MEDTFKTCQHSLWFLQHVTMPMMQRKLRVEVISVLKQTFGIAQETSWEMLELEWDQARGPLSKEFGLMPSPLELATADSQLPQQIVNTIRKLPQWYSDNTTREELEKLPPFSTGDLVGLPLFRAKQALYIFAQCYIDAGRELEHTLTGTVGQYIPPLPDSLFFEMKRLSVQLDCFPACTSHDIFYQMKFSEDFLDRLRSGQSRVTDMHWRDMDVMVRCLTGKRSGESEADRALREHVEVRFHTLAGQMAYIAAELPNAIATSQHIMFLTMHGNMDCKIAIEQLEKHFQKMIDISRQLTKTFECFKVAECPADVWHAHIAKLTAGAYQFPGPSGPEFIPTMLLDVLLNRLSYQTEVGQLVIAARAKLPSNQRRFVEAVERGPNVAQFAAFLQTSCTKRRDTEESESIIIAQQFDEMVETLFAEHVEKGFLAAHKRKATFYIDQGFKKCGPRSITGGTFFSIGEKQPQLKIKEALTTAIDERSVGKATKQMQNQSNTSIIGWSAAATAVVAVLWLVSKYDYNNSNNNNSTLYNDISSLMSSAAASSRSVGHLNR